MTNIFGEIEQWIKDAIAKLETLEQDVIKWFNGAVSDEQAQKIANDIVAAITELQDSIESGDDQSIFDALGKLTVAIKEIKGNTEAINTIIDIISKLFAKKAQANLEAAE